MATESNTKETKIVRATPKKTDSQQEEPVSYTHLTLPTNSLV